MSYWLDKNGGAEAYAGKPAKAKQAFLEAWFAEKLANQKASKSYLTQKEIINGKESEDAWEWVSRKMLADRLGEDKAAAQVDSGKLETRPDPLTGKDCELHREYKLYTRKGAHKEQTNDRQQINIDQELADEKDLKEAAESMQSAFASMAGSSGDITTPARQGTEGTASGVPIKTEPQDGAAEPPHFAYKAKLETDMKKETRCLAEKIMTTKEMYAATKTGGKYLAQLHDDLSQLIPCMAKLYASLERAHLDGNTDEATIVALSKSLMDRHNEFSELHEWYLRMVPKAAKKAKKNT